VDEPDRAASHPSGSPNARPPGSRREALGRGAAAQVPGSQIALAASNYLVLAIAARHLDPAGFAALTSYYLLINTVGRGIFAAVELEATRAVAAADALGRPDRPARRAAIRHTLLLLAGAVLLVAACGPLLGRALGSALSAVALLTVGAAAMAASYLLRGPLAGHRRYGLYAATFWVEAALGLGTAGLLVVADVGDTTPWIAAFALAPLVTAMVLGPAAVRVRSSTGGGSAGASAEQAVAARGGVFWSAALLLAGQGVWNLAPVLVTSRLTDAPAVAAGFVTVAVILRAPVLLFPSVQALLLPVLTAMVSTGDDGAVRRTTRRLAVILAFFGAVWVLVAVLLVPSVSHVVFAATVTPPPWVLAVLAASTVIGAAAQIGQTYLVAARRPAAAASAWIVGLGVLLLIGLAFAPPVAAATVGQFVAAVVVLVVLTLVRRRPPVTVR
jgi:O-antigen/teichoic acid export membrane protein